MHISESDLDPWPSTHNTRYQMIRWHIYVIISIFGSLQTEISQIESSCFTPNAWKSMGILQSCDIFKEGLLTVFVGMQPFLWISKWGLAQFGPTQWLVWRTPTFHLAFLSFEYSARQKCILSFGGDCIISLDLLFGKMQFWGKKLDTCNMHKMGVQGHVYNSIIQRNNPSCTH